MVELITEMLLYLALAAVLGLVLGYCIWGWGTAARISAARADGAAAARTSVDGSAGLRERLQECEAERHRQTDEINDLLEQLAEARARTSNEAVEAPATGSEAADQPFTEAASQPDLEDATDAQTEAEVPTEDIEKPTVATPETLFTERPEEVDDLKRIKGVGKVMEGVLNAKGIYLFRQLAALDESEIAWVNQAIEAFPGRIVRDRWVEQAQELHLEKYGRRHDDDTT